MSKIHLRMWEGTEQHPHMRTACSPPWMNDRGEYTFEATDNPMEVTCSACQRTKAWGDVMVGKSSPRSGWVPDVVAHRDADGIVTLQWRDDQIRETTVSRELLEQLVEQGNRLQRILKATQCEHDFSPRGLGREHRVLWSMRAQASVAGPE